MGPAGAHNRGGQGGGWQSKLAWLGFVRLGFQFCTKLCFSILNIWLGFGRSRLGCRIRQLLGFRFGRGGLLDEQAKVVFVLVLLILIAA